MFEKDKYYYETLENFQKLIEEQIYKYPQVKDILIDIEKHSPTTFNHSINVGLHTYEKLNNYKGRFNEEKVKNWTLAAVLHDIGKLNTPLEILHGSNLSKEQAKVMMDHSIKIKNLVKKYHVEELPKECYIAMRGHHIAYTSVENDFENAHKTKGFWNNYTNLTEDMRNHFKGMDTNDKFALEMITFFDSIEAQRSNDRSYKEGFSWDRIKDNTKDDINVNPDTNLILINSVFVNYLNNEKYLQHFDNLQLEKISDKIREMIGIKEKTININKENDEHDIERE